MDRRRVALAALACICTVVFGYRVWREAWITDDALITFRYVDHLVRGDGLVFNPGERIEGFSNPLFMLLLTPAAACGADLLAAAQWLGALFGALELLMVLGLTWHLTRRLLPTAMASALFATDRIVAVWSTGGLETSMHGALLTAAFGLAVVRRQPPDRGVVAVTALYLAAAVSRPEGGLFYLAYLGWLVLGGRRDGTWKANLRRSLIIFGTAAAALLAIRFAYYGELVANPYRAKMSGVPNLELGMLYLGALLRRLGLADPLQILAWLSLIALAFIGWRQAHQPAGRGAPVLLALAHVGLGLAAIVIMGGDYMTDFRLARPLMGTLYVAVGAGVGWSLAARSRWLTTAALAASAAVAISHAAGQAHPNPIAADAPPPVDHKAGLTVTAARADHFARALERVAEPGDSLLVDLSGVRGYGHRYRAVDASGLLSADISRDFEPRADINEYGKRERLPGHAWWPRVDYMQREGFTFIFPKISRRPPEYPEINPRAPRRHRGYPFIHVTVPLGDGTFFRFFTTLAAEQLEARAARNAVRLCYRAPRAALHCTGP